MYRYKECEVCGDKLLINKTKIGTSNSKSLSASYYYDSNEGVLYLRKWFCNKCWSEIISNG